MGAPGPPPGRGGLAFRGAPRPVGRGRGGPAAAPAVAVKALTAGLVPKRLAWQPLPKAKLKDTMFLDFDLTKDDDATAIDFGLLDEMFCRNKVDIEAEE